MSDLLRKEKASLREVLRARRAAIDETQACRAGQRAAALLIDWLQDRPLAAVLLYAALPGEVDTEPLERALRARGAQVAYPRVIAPGRLALHLATRAELERGRHGIPEPPEGAPLLSPAALDLVLVPGLGFDPQGWRLGLGGGYYDVLLAEAPRALRCGLCHPFQLLPRIPAEPHDVPVDLVVHEELILTAVRPLPGPSRPLVLATEGTP